MKIIVIFESGLIGSVSGYVKRQYRVMKGIYSEVGANNFTPPTFLTGDIGVAGQRVIDKNYRCMFKWLSKVLIVQIDFIINNTRVGIEIIDGYGFNLSH